uniref:Putative glycosyltransferase n=1 Tax=viral metagenome TaxID=1070528 RepID=A0A6M3M4Y5_9ZZZZ
MNVHILSDTPRATSAYAIITRNFASGLVERGHNVTITGFLNGYENWNGIDVLPLATPFIHPQVQFASNLKSSRANVLICIHEAHADANIYSQMFSPTFFWVPVEGEGILPHMKHDLTSPGIAGVVPMSQIGEKHLESVGVACRDSIYPGWDPGIFTKKHEPYCRWSMDIYRQTQNPKLLCERGCFTCESKKEGCRHFENERMMINIGGNEFSGDIQTIDKIKDNLGAEFVIGCVAQNVGLRKRLERLIEAFSKMENRKESLLHLHTLPVSQRGFNLFEIAKKYNVLDRIIFSYGETAVYGISDHGMNLLYNYFDMNVSASSYEGFGMPVLESESIGKPQVAPACGTFPELLGENERGLLAGIATSSMDADGITRSLVDTGSLAEKMDALCIDANLRRKLGDAGAEWAKQFTWDKIVNQWDTLLSETEERTKIRRVEKCPT